VPARPRCALRRSAGPLDGSSGTRALAARIAWAVLDFAFPDACIACGRPIARGRRHLCAACTERLRAAPGTIDLPIVRGRARPTRALYAAPFESPLAELVRGLKYGGRVSAAAVLGGLLASLLPAATGSAWLVAPVPLHRTRRRERGFNQAELIAGSLAGGLGLPLRADALSRRRATPSQTALPRHERIENVRGAFASTGRLPANARVILVDDVVTTGATLAEAAAALLVGGAETILPVAAAGNVEGSGAAGRGPETG